MTRQWRATGALLCAAALLSACSGGSEPAADPTLPEIGFGTSTPSPSEVEDEWAAPDTLTEEYVIRVLTEIERERAGFFRYFVDADLGAEVPEDVKDHIRRTYIATSAEGFIEQIVAGYRERGHTDTLADPYGQYYPINVVLHRDEPGCSLIQTDWDASTVSADGSSNRSSAFIMLGPQVLGAPVNDTGWVYSVVLDAADISQADVDRELEERLLCD